VKINLWYMVIELIKIVEKLWMFWPRKSSPLHSSISGDFLPLLTGSFCLANWDDWDLLVWADSRRLLRWFKFVSICLWLSVLIGRFQSIPDRQEFLVFILYYNFILYFCIIFSIEQEDQGICWVEIDHFSEHFFRWLSDLIF
jgi:hypothetical protein